jgi:hypothetical protein
MRIDEFSFGRITVDGVTYEHDIVLDQGKIRKRKKKPSKPFRDAFGHTPLSAEEKIPWKCRRLIIGTGVHGNLPVMDEVKRQAARHKIELVILPPPTPLRAYGSHRRGPTRSFMSHAERRVLGLRVWGLRVPVYEFVCRDC